MQDNWVCRSAQRRDVGRDWVGRTVFIPRGDDPEGRALSSIRRFDHDNKVQRHADTIRFTHAYPTIPNKQRNADDCHSHVGVGCRCGDVDAGCPKMTNVNAKNRTVIRNDRSICNERISEDVQFPVSSGLEGALFGIWIPTLSGSELRAPRPGIICNNMNDQSNNLRCPGVGGGPCDEIEVDDILFSFPPGLEGQLSSWHRGFFNCNSFGSTVGYFPIRGASVAIPSGPRQMLSAYVGDGCPQMTHKRGVEEYLRYWLRGGIAGCM